MVLVRGRRGGEVVEDHDAERDEESVDEGVNYRVGLGRLVVCC